jgi:AcrR family transcriptional regulator
MITASVPLPVEIAGFGKQSVINARVSERNATIRWYACAMSTESVPLSGRRAEAARNNTRILESAKAVFVANPAAPISAVAEHAGVGISALYRRYPSKEDLLRKLCADGLQIYLNAVEAALDDKGDPWTAFVTFMETIVAANSLALTVKLAGTFTPTEDLYRDSARGQEMNQQLVERTKKAGALREDIDVNDLTFIFEQLSAIKIGDEARSRQLRMRYLALFLQAMHTGGDSPLPGPAPSWQEVAKRWEPE